MVLHEESEDKNKAKSDYYQSRGYKVLREEQTEATRSGLHV